MRSRIGRGFLAWCGRLPPEQRRVVLMRFVEQRSVREIAAAMQKTEGAVKQLQFRAVQSLREKMVKADG